MHTTTHSKKACKDTKLHTHKTHSEPTNGAEVVAARLEEVAQAIAAGAAPPSPSPLIRMRDTVVFGYLMASAKDSKVDVPEW